MNKYKCDRCNMPVGFVVNVNDEDCCPVCLAEVLEILSEQNEKLSKDHVELIEENLTLKSRIMKMSLENFATPLENELEIISNLNREILSLFQLVQKLKKLKTCLKCKNLLRNPFKIKRKRDTKHD